MVKIYWKYKYYFRPFFSCYTQYFFIFVYFIRNNVFTFRFFCIFHPFYLLYSPYFQNSMSFLLLFAILSHFFLFLLLFAIFSSLFIFSAFIRYFFFVILFHLFLHLLIVKIVCWIVIKRTKSEGILRIKWERKGENEEKEKVPA